MQSLPSYHGGYSNSEFTSGRSLGEEEKYSDENVESGHNDAWNESQQKEKGTEISRCDRRRWKSVGETDGDRGGDMDKSPVGGRRRSSGAENQRNTQEGGKEQV
ncbi:hypothetical protein Pcinc_018615 [Petrolisthes cinctipes]|uniref:Uncharacterized protein n=1 Tax=Petrolisthes cinctipes TaxID=88211 RepID=A0AAE1FLU5_PETCI|nr:hypothetical protein Pcinc_018615 [Petrolisthes cinctipes]